jgi:flavoprotein
LIPASPGSEVVTAYFHYKRKAPEIERAAVVAWGISGAKIEMAITPLGALAVKSEREDTFVYAARAMKINGRYYDLMQSYATEKEWLEEAHERWNAIVESIIGSEIRRKPHEAA